MRNRLLRAKTVSAIILAAILTVSFVFQVNALSYGLQSQKIDNAGNAARDCSIAIDSKGYPHVSYSDGNFSGLKYAYWNGISWTIQVIENGGITGVNGLHSTIKLDQNDHPHIAYLDLDSGHYTYLRYASWDGQTWTIQTVDTYASWYTSLAIDANGDPHITYCNGASLKYASRVGSNWIIETIEPGVLYVNDQLGAYSSLQFDSDGYPCVSYSDRANGLLKYASWDGSKWNLEVVDSGATVDVDNSLVLDSNNKPTVLYFFDDGLRIAKQNSGVWTIQTIDTTGDPRYQMSYPSIILDSKGKPNICYIDQYRQSTAKYALSDGSAWKIYGLTESAHTQHSLAMAIDANDTIHMVMDNGGAMEYLHFDPQALGTPIPVPDPTPTPVPAPYTTPASPIGTPKVFDYFWNSGKYSSIALDAANNPHVSFFDANYGLKYAYCNGSAWRVVSVDVSGWYGLYTSIAVDSQGYPHISYYDNWDSNLKYAYWNGTQWSKQIVDTNGGAFTSIVLDLNDYPAIGYKTSAGELKYACWNGSRWVIQTVDSAANANCLSLALDSSGKPSICYYDWRNSDLKYACWTGSGWSIQVVDSAGAVGWSPSLKVDSKGNAHISYLDNTNGCLKYATSTESGWSIQTIDYVNTIWSRSQNWINATSLALDANDYPHIAYFDGVGGNLRYAFWNGLAWVIQIADASFNVGYSASLALDSAGRAHISYSDEYNPRYVCSVNSSGFLPNVAPNALPTPSPKPTATTKGTSSSSSTTDTPKPTDAPIITKTSYLDLTCKSKTAIDALSIQVTGELRINGIGVQEAEITLAYSSNNGITWNNLPSCITDISGQFCSDSQLPSTGTYLIRATWAGNSTCQSVTKTINYALTSANNQNILSIISNSTVSAVGFNSTSNAISFSVHGVSGTTGYIEFSIAKSILTNPTDLHVYLDNAEMPYTVSSREDSWLVTFTYNHSSHDVRIQFTSSSTPAGAGFFDWGIPVVLIALIAVFLIGGLLMVRTKRGHSAANKLNPGF